MKRRFFLALAGLVLAAGHAMAGPERNVTADPTFPDYGNKWRGINVNCSTHTAILISSTPANSPYSIGTWRFREVVNTSNAGLLMVDKSTYTVFSSTWSIFLASGTNGKGDSWVVPGQAAVYGIWSSGCTSGGAGGSEHFWHN